MVLSCDGSFAGPGLCAGIMNMALELAGAYGVRVKVIGDRALRWRGGSLPAGVGGAVEPETRRLEIEVRGVFYQAIKNVFPNAVDIVDPALGKYFEEDIDADAWYDAEAYVKAVEYLVAHISPEAMVFLGNEFVEILRERFEAIGVRTIEDFAAKAPRLYHEFVRGPEGEGWEIEEYRPGRIVIRETGFLPYVYFISGVIKRTVEELGGLNVRVTVLDDRARGAEANRYVAEWIEPDEG